MSLVAVLALFAATPVQVACPADADPIPPALSAWSEGRAVTASPDADAAPVIANDATAALALHPSDHVRLLAAPRRAAQGVSHAGYVAVEITTPGTYRVALSDRAWIEMLRDGKPVASTTHGHGPRCSGMRKIVDFPLTAGHHVLQISGNPTASVRVMVIETR